MSASNPSQHNNDPGSSPVETSRTKCRRCLLPAAAPNANLDQQGVCGLCRIYQKEHQKEQNSPGQSSTAKSPSELQRQQREADLEEALKTCKGASKQASSKKRPAEYDALVCLSGGKDSIALLYKIKVEYGLNVLAFTTDIDIPPVAWANIKRTIDKLEVDHLIYRPSDAFYTKMFNYLLRRQEQRGAVYTVSYVYAPLFEGDALRVATEKNIPLVLAGYSPGQPEPERMLYEFSRELICATDWTPPQLKQAPEFDTSELARFWNPQDYPEGTEFPRYLAPFHAWEYNQEDIMKQVVECGLVANSRHASPIYSNYPINWLLMYSDLKNLGYNPYAPEFSDLIRDGRANLNYWRIMGPVVDFMIKHKILLGSNVTKSLKWLNLSAEDLTITLPQGVYDPPPIAKGVSVSSETVTSSAEATADTSAVPQ